MHFKLYLAFFLALVHTSPGQVTPKLMGTFGNETYYYDNELRNRSASKAYCESAYRLTTADFPTLEHIQFVKDYAEMDSEFNAVAGHWTSAQHQFRMSQFAWLGTEESVPDDFPFGGVNGPYFGLYLNELGLLVGEPAESVELGVICRTRLPCKAPC